MSIRNHTTPEGREIGRTIAKWCDDAEPKARLRMPELPPRCNSCACRKGRHLANASPFTQMDFLKCILEGHEFYCHEPAREGQLCSGWVMFMLVKDDAEFREMPWPYLTEKSAQIPEPRVGEYRADYSMPARQQLDEPQPTLDELFKNSERISK